MVPWPLIALLAGPKRTATMWGFWKAPFPGKAVTNSLRSTPVVSKFSCLIKVVMTSAYWFSSSILSSGVIGLVSSTPDMAGEVVLSSFLHKAGILLNRSVTYWCRSRWQWWIHSSEASWAGFGPLASSPQTDPPLAPDDVPFGEHDMLFHPLSQLVDTSCQGVEIWVLWQIEFLCPIL